MSIPVIINIAIMVALVAFLYRLQKQHLLFTRRVFIALGLGVVYGAFLQFVYGSSSAVVLKSVDWFNIIGNGYVALLKMIIMPLIMVSVISAIIKLKGAGAVGKISFWVLGLLMLTVSLSAIIGVGSAFLFDLNAETITGGSRETERAAVLLSQLGTVEALSIPSMLVSLLPANPFMDMTGARSTSVIAVVIFSAFVGVATLDLHRKKPETFAAIEGAIDTLHKLVMRMVTLVLRLTPFGILALMTKVVASSHIADILQLIRFVGASYLALAVTFGLHLLMVSLVGGNPFMFVQKALPTLSFAFSSRSSAGTMPLTIQTLTRRMGISEGVANFAASFGTTIGQNGCAGIYPAMLAVMIAPSVGIDPTSLGFLGTLIVTIVIGSFGVAGIGGGATFAALIVLSALGLPVELAGLLISVEPLIDMGRTAVNVSGAMTSGFVSGRILGDVDMDVFNGKDSIELDMETNS